MLRIGSSPKPEYGRHVASTLPATPDLLDQLSLEDRQIQHLWAELQRAHRHDRGETHPVGAVGHFDSRRGVSGLTSQAEYSHQIIAAVADHAALKSEALYPLAVGVMGQDWVEHAKAGDADLADRLREVDGQITQDDAVFERFSEAMTRFQVQSEEEERIVYPSMRIVLSADKLRSPRHTPRFEPYIPPPEIIDLTSAGQQPELAAHGHHEAEAAAAAASGVEVSA